ncbi:hypothetical protein ETAA8_42690 [Anatilimnocola aggregata]|uniref:Uncharacterized protein n=1 Tax=Anatilimnocola aggregata TaxID=2528021 RepID=A0A517YG51_9BACT|nr:hypothetical protein [Anatilimnocola aggregata]QDU29162.1 hypothetical protein ETAA8_42690 [Anatilimnocola aggregata]
MKSWILASATALVAVAGLAGHAAEPWSNPQVRSSAARTPVFPAAHAWVNSMRQETAAPTAPALAPAITGHAGVGMNSPREVIGDGAMISQTSWNHEHQYTGYVFGPGSCDYTPPCVDHLWNGYCQRPHRCHGHGHRHCHLRGSCGIATSGCATCDTGSAASCDSGCGVARSCHGCFLHSGRHRYTGLSCGNSCSSCGDACGTGCGHGHGLFSGKHRGWFANLCNACDGDLSCGCAAPVGDMSSPESVPTPAADDNAAPLADDAKSARREMLNRYIPWSLK